MRPGAHVRLVQDAGWERIDENLDGFIENVMCNGSCANNYVIACRAGNAQW